jgi:hypothetical protein
LEDLGDNIEISVLFGGFVEIDRFLSSNGSWGENVVGPFSEGSENGNILSFDGGFLSWECVWCIGWHGGSEWGCLVGGEESVWGLVEHVDVELSLVLVDSHVGSVNSDDVSESVDDWEVFEFVGIDDNWSILSLGVEGWVNNLEGADESIGVSFVWEGSIDNDTVEVAWFTWGEGCFVKFDVFVLYICLAIGFVILTFDPALAGDLDLVGVDFLADFAIFFELLLKLFK